MARRASGRPRGAPGSGARREGHDSSGGPEGGEGFGSPGGTTIASDGQDRYAAAGRDSTQQ
jgi:hypothetical protein